MNGQNVNTMKNTLENKLNFLASHSYNGVILCTRYTPREFSVIEMIPEMADDIQDYDGEHMGCYTLLRKSLSNISDEDAIEIAKANPWSDYREDEDLQPYINHVKEFLKYPRQLTLDVVDKLRELGYALPWNGVTVEEQIEYGWIKLK